MMKPLALTFLLALFGTATALAQTKSLKFEAETLDLGKLKKSEGTVTTAFTYRNVNLNKNEVGIVEIQPLCECIIPEYSEDPIGHWETAEIKVTYDPSKVEAGEFKNSMYVITDAFENNYQLFVTGTVIDDVEDGGHWLTVDDLKKTEDIVADYRMPLGFDVVFVDSTDKRLRKFVDKVGNMVEKEGNAEVLIEASTSNTASKKYEEKVTLAEERMTKALRILVLLMESKEIDDDKVSFITSAFVDGPEVEDEDDEKSQYQSYEYIHLKLSKAKEE